jgi:hypothetical protein
MVHVWVDSLSVVVSSQGGSINPLSIAEDTSIGAGGDGHTRLAPAVDVDAPAHRRPPLHTRHRTHPS